MKYKEILNESEQQEFIGSPAFGPATRARINTDDGTINFKLESHNQTALIKKLKGKTAQEVTDVFVPELKKMIDTFNKSLVKLKKKM